MQPAFMKKIRLCLLLLALCLGAQAQQTIDVARYGIRPDTGKDMTPRVRKMLQKIGDLTTSDEGIILRFAPGRYDFHPDRAAPTTTRTTPSVWGFPWKT